MKIENIRVDEIRPYEKNAKKHPAEQIKNIAQSIEDFGWQQPIVIDKDGVIIIGHGRYEAALRLGLETVPCTRADALTEEEAKKLRLLDNKLNESEWDLDLLAEEMRELNYDDYDFGDYNLEWDIPEAAQEREIIEDTVPDKYKARCKRGDLWLLGNHRLLCGDSIDSADVKKLMGGGSC